MIRVRFAPSPTGPLHIGGVRTALYNYLFAKKNKGAFILRIEDTDQKRFVDNAEQYIYDAFEWLNIKIDESPLNPNSKYGPYKQSERKEIYQKHIEILLKKGKAYYAFDTAEELEAIRATEKNFSYNYKSREKLRNSLTLTEKETKTLISQNVPYVIRFKIEHGVNLNLEDEIRGNIKINTDVLDDKVLMKADGLPTYHLANIVDDHLMDISHVIRGEEWLPSMALHILLYQAFDWTPPKFAHLSLILKENGKGKLSKRDSEAGNFPIFPLQYENSPGYKEFGFEPNALSKFLINLGWSLEEIETLDLDQISNKFELSSLSKSGVQFDYKKALHINQQEVKIIDNQVVKLILEKKYPTSKLDIQRIVELYKERLEFRNDIIKLTSYLFDAPKQYDFTKFKKFNLKEIDLLPILSKFVETSSEEFKEWIKENEYPMGRIMQNVRTGLVGELSGIDIFDIRDIIGIEETNKRLNDYHTAYLRLLKD